MEQLKNKFLKELAKGLGNYEGKESILQEYEAHLDELLAEFMDVENEREIQEQIMSRLGSPDEIASMWRAELSVTPSKMKWLFFLLNIVFFTGGSVLTLIHNLYQWDWLSGVWLHLTAIPIIIAFIYMFFWALLGYEIGKGFGHKGKRLLKKTFLLSLIPNLVLMILTVFQIIPHNWFEPLLSREFIFTCIIFTIFLYPISLIGYRWGKKASI